MGAVRSRSPTIWASARTASKPGGAPLAGSAGFALSLAHAPPQSRHRATVQPGAMSRTSPSRRPSPGIPAYTAFAGRKKAVRITARLIVRRVRNLAKPGIVGEQAELFPAWRATAGHDPPDGAEAV